MQSETNIKVSDWEVKFDSYRRPLIKSNEKNFLLLYLEPISDSEILVNKKYILTKENCINCDNKFRDEKVNKLESLLFKK